MTLFMYDLLIWCGPLAVSYYTLTYALWLWRQKEKRAAIGIAALAGFTALYPGYVLFFVHQ